MHIANRYRVAAYFLAFVLPILFMMNCSGWNAGSVSVRSCYFENELMIEAANMVIGFLFISSFMGFLPIVVYALVVIGVIELIIVGICKNGNS